MQTESGPLPCGTGAAMAPAMELALRANFGSLERWRDEFVALGQALAGGCGCAQLLFQPHDATLVNLSTTGRGQAPAGAVPLLALDIDIDIGAAAAQCVEAFMQDIDWERVYQRYQQAVEQASEPFGAAPDDLAGALVLDVRRAAIYEQSDQLIPGAQWRDPADVGAWSAQLPADRDVVVYCVYGHEVGRATALRLRAAGLRARYLRGGIDAWAAAGRPVSAKRAG